MKRILNSIRNRFLFKKNVFKTNYDKNALLSYIVNPFSQHPIKSHSNYLESINISNVLNEVGYNVDVVNFNSKKKINYNKYSLLIGFGYPFENSFYQNNDCIRIFYGTGSNRMSQNAAELNRIKLLWKRKHVLLEPRRVLNDCWSKSLVLSDAIFLIGNEITKSTYSECNENILLLPAPIENITDVSLQRDYSKAKKKFIWWGSSGAVHKGLDLVLETFMNLKEIQLVVCGNISNERDFLKVYRDELTNQKNIEFIGFVNLNSPAYYELASSAMFTILPSCSEGMASGIINNMATGLIPVVTKETGVKILDPVLEIKDLNVNNLKNQVTSLSNLDIDKLKYLSQAYSQYAKTNNTEDRFKNLFKESLKLFINK